MSGYFIISLDFEMRWGVLERFDDFDKYRENILNEKKVVKKLLDLFEEYNVPTTWAIVGAIGADDFNQFLNFSPPERPTFQNHKLSAYTYLDQMKNNQEQFFSPNTIKLLKSKKRHEIASHSFTHLLLGDDNITEKDLENELEAVKKIYEIIDIPPPKSYVFCRNEVRYLNILAKNGFVCYRGNQKSFIYKKYKNLLLKHLARFFILIDHHLPVCHRCFNPDKDESGMNNVRASLFLRPFSGHMLQKIRTWRIKKSIDYASKHNVFFHLWWHPHNFGKNIDENLYYLREILEYAKVRGMQFLTMSQCDKFSNSIT